MLNRERPTLDSTNKQQFPTKFKKGFSSSQKKTTSGIEIRIPCCQNPSISAFRSPPLRIFAFWTGGPVSDVNAAFR
jgi:hypothetical protein